MFIDKNGRLFGKINLIDFLVILFAIYFIFGLIRFSWIYQTKPAVNKVVDPKIQAYEELKGKVDIFLEEHKGARKYFQ